MFHKENDKNWFVKIRVAFSVMRRDSSSQEDWTILHTISLFDYVTWPECSIFST